MGPQRKPGASSHTRTPHSLLTNHRRRQTWDVCHSTALRMGYFTTEHAAARAYNVEARRQAGPYTESVYDVLTVCEIGCVRVH